METRLTAVAVPMPVLDMRVCFTCPIRAVQPHCLIVKGNPKVRYNACRPFRAYRGEVHTIAGCMVGVFCLGILLAHESLKYQFMPDYRYYNHGIYKNFS